MKKENFKRRAFLKASALAGMALGASGKIFGGNRAVSSTQALLEGLAEPRPARGQSVIGLRVPRIEQVKIGVIGLGNRGSFHASLSGALYPEKAIVTAICDIREERVEAALADLREKGQSPATYSGSADAWKEMVSRDDIDLVIIATPWNDHVPMALGAMAAGKHVACEVPMALTVEDCWKLVDMAEEQQLNCMMMENVCYGDEELWVLNMVRQGVFGELTYGEAAYIHNLRDSLFSPDGYYNMWRIRHHVESDGNLYPTHGLGPVAQYMDIDRGDRFETLVSMSTREASLSEAAKTVDARNEFYNASNFRHGDMNNSLIKTARGRSILVQHDVVTPRPYSRINALGGTKAYHEGYPSRLAIAGQGHEWLDDKEYEEYRERFRHPIWARLKEGIEKHGGHGGMDFVMLYRIVDCLNNGWPLDMDVYDAVDWSVVTPLSSISIDLGSVPVKFPDFTRGRWKEERRLGIFEYM